ncbi:hypothetical protein CAPTEDRAFT_169392 [Capitella teleta]|uniref:BAAT/Acyl-CoA thioester hydrolase C-terminal domain-containing protein n=1 Tax=Capitella teleta TaxID=283909 RepID=R7UC03_CAPTE|nr:hypothetical protein CAPTEDRAFT_169392 [Capitella teleta]|eukprot:ELU00797.1 hypothetical protein CAPTEDRAFT_169392 [Capitella teleta]
MSSVYLTVNPKSSLFDEDVSICVHGLQPHQKVQLRAELVENGDTMESFAQYTSDHMGSIDLSRLASEGGTYEGKSSMMGLFWSLEPAPNQRPGIRLMKKNVTTPLRMSISVLGDDDSVLASESCERWFLASGVQRVNVRNGRLRGTMFIPQGNGPFPGVIDLYGTSGGLIEYRAALLASKGFVTFALAYFGFDDLPKWINLDMEYFEEGIDFLQQHPKVSKGGIGAIGISKGSDIATYMSIINPMVKAVVRLNGAQYLNTGVHRFQGEEIPSIDLATEYIETMEDGSLNFKQCYIHSEQESDLVFEIEKSKAQFLMVAGEDDLMTTPWHQSKLIDRLVAHGKNNYTLLSYPGAGHLLEPPCSPHCGHSYHRLTGTSIAYGGEKVAHVRAQEHMWPRIISFFHRNLGSGLKSQL